MSSGSRLARGRSSRRAVWTGRAAGLGAFLAWIAVTFGPAEIEQRFGSAYSWAFGLLVLCIAVLLHVRRIHRRGQTFPEAMAAARAERRRRAETRERARQAAAALPWLRDKGLSPAAVPGVLITPPPSVPGYYLPGYDVVLDSPGPREFSAVLQTMRLTRLHPKDARALVESAPVTVLRVPDSRMAGAARAILECSGATVSVIDHASYR